MATTVFSKPLDKDVSEKLDVYQGTTNTGKYMKVGNDGNLAPAELDMASKLDVNQGSSNSGKYMKVGSTGDLAPAELDMNSKLDVNQGSVNSGKYMKVGSTGDLAPAELDMDSKADLNDFIIVLSSTTAPFSIPSESFILYQGTYYITTQSYNAGDTITLSEPPPGAFGIGFVNIIKNNKLDKNQGTNNAGKYMKVNSSGILEPAVLDALPAVTSSDEGKFLRVVNGAWAAVTVPPATEVSF